MTMRGRTISLTLLCMQDGNVCLADWCEVLHCDHFAGKPGTRHFFHHHTAACRPKAKNKLKQQCQARHACNLSCTVPNAYFSTTCESNTEASLSNNTILLFVASGICRCIWMEACSSLNTITCCCLQELAESCFSPSVSKESTLMYGKQDSTLTIPMCIF